MPLWRFASEFLKIYVASVFLSALVGLIERKQNSRVICKERKSAKDSSLPWYAIVKFPSILIFMIGFILYPFYPFDHIITAFMNNCYINAIKKLFLVLHFLAKCMIYIYIYHVISIYYTYQTIKKIQFLRKLDQSLLI